MYEIPDPLVAVCAAFVVAQALTICALLGARPLDRVAHRWLLLALVAAGLTSMGDLLLHLHLDALRRWLDPLASASLLAVGPGLWLYTTALTSRPPAYQPGWRRAGPHLVPAASLFALLLVEAVAAAPPPAGAMRTQAELWSLLPVAGQMGAYLVAIVRRVLRLRSALREEYSDVSQRSLQWLVVVAGLFAGVVAVWVGTWWAPVGLSNLLSNLLIGAAVAVSGVFGLRQRNVFARLYPQAPEVEQPPAPYAKASLQDTQAQAIGGRLDAVIREDKPYLECDLTLAELAGRIQATPHQLSQYLSQHRRLSFYDYINGLRVDAVKATLERPQSHGRPILEIALECGFGSKSTFNAVFRRATGMTPGAYRGSARSAQATV